MLRVSYILGDRIGERERKEFVERFCNDEWIEKGDIIEPFGIPKLWLSSCLHKVYAYDCPEEPDDFKICNLSKQIRKEVLQYLIDRCSEELKGRFLMLRAVPSDKRNADFNMEVVDVINEILTKTYKFERKLINGENNSCNKEF